MVTAIVVVATLAVPALLVWMRRRAEDRGTLGSMSAQWVFEQRFTDRMM